MAIVKMKKLTLIGLDRRRDEALETLMKLGVVEISDKLLESEDDILNLTRDGDESYVARLENDISRVKFAIDYLSRFYNRKKSFFSGKAAYSEETVKKLLSDEKPLWDIVDNVFELDRKLAELKAEENKINNFVDSIMPWISLRIPFETVSTNSTEIVLGTIPNTKSIDDIYEALLGIIPSIVLEKINSDNEQYYVLIVYHKDFQLAASEALKSFGFNKVPFKDVTGTAEENIKASQDKIERIGIQREQFNEMLKSFASEKDKLELLYDTILIKRDRTKELSRLAKTERTYIIRGWIPENDCEKLVRAMDTSECIIDFEDPAEGEEYPILLKNNKLVQPFELITELYSLPKSSEVDPNLFMAPFFFIFFGLMVSDAGYGLLISLISGLALFKLKPSGMASKLIRLMFLCGISTLIWGALFGGWFGDMVSAVTNGRYSIKPIWFNPLDDPMKLLIWSFVFGLLHIFAGMALRAYMLIRDGKILDAVFDVFSWYIFIIGLAMLALGGTMGNIGSYIAAAGAGILVLTQGRSEKNLIKRFFKGLLSLYGITSYLSDVLSYSRLLALGLATGVIASVINTMGTLFGFNILGILILIIVFVIGTVFNILINALGAYVHSSRLQYVEFFGKFYEGGGKAYQPFKINTKYTNITYGRTE